jgi:hypothetical protein
MLTSHINSSIISVGGNMKITKANLETLRYSERTGKYYKGNNTYIRNEACSACGEPFLQSTSNKGTTCSPACRRKGLHHSEETKKKISETKKEEYSNPENHPFYGRHHTKKSKTKMSKSKKGKKCGEENHNWNGGYRDKNLPYYDTYAPQLEIYQKVKRNKEDKNVMEVKCHNHKCQKWFIPTRNSVKNRLGTINGNKGYKGEQNLYCSDDCKNSCYLYGKNPETLMHEDEWRAGRDPWWDEPRHMQGQWRKLVLERDNYTCQKCGSTENLKAHHIKPVKLYPLESADVDNGIILCGECHNKAHHIPGCSTGELAKLC